MDVYYIPGIGPNALYSKSKPNTKGDNKEHRDNRKNEKTQHPPASKELDVKWGYQQIIR